MSNWSREYRVDGGGRRQIVITENKPAKPYEPLYMKFFKVMTRIMLIGVVIVFILTRFI